MKKMTAGQHLYKILRDRLYKRMQRHPENGKHDNIYQLFHLADGKLREAVCEGKITPELYTYWLSKAEQSTRSAIWPKLPNI
jgi:hypothetical protein